MKIAERHQWIAPALIALAMCLAWKASRAEQLALISTPSETCKAGTARTACTTQRLDKPQAGDLVFPCPTLDACWQNNTALPAAVFGDLPATTPIDGCNNPDAATRGKVLPFPWDATKDPCGNNWKIALKSAYAVNTTGSITLTWSPVTLCTDPTDSVAKACNDPAHPTWAIQGYKIYSGVSQTALGLLQTVGANVFTLPLNGYGDGTYYFAVTAFNGQGESIKSSIASVEVKKPTTPADSKALPVSVEGVVLKVTFP